MVSIYTFQTSSKSIKNIEEAKYFICRESTEIWGY
jgi:hypothetical protein